MQNSYCYKINLFNSYETPWEGSRVCKKKYLKSINWLRQKVLSKNLRYPFYRFDKEKRIQLIDNGGWHFNSLMPPKEISLKYCHQRGFAHIFYK
jgi:beta-1,4-mannosyl-glycoprotein beta-1,4-N-acetylglucosaminyltransferase